MNTEARYLELKRELDAGRLMQQARELTGLRDFGDEDFREPLLKLLDCAARDTDFHAAGLQFFINWVVRLLVNRLRLHDDLKKHPEILDEDVSDPIIVIGLGRSGTTKLHQMFSAPDNVQKTLFWRIWNPGRFDAARPGRPDPRIAAAGSTDLIAQENAVIASAHHVAVNAVEENWALLMFTFDNWCWNAVTPAPSYFDWVIDRPADAVLGYEKYILQHLQWQDGGKRGRPWILKAAGYISNMDSLLKTYPDATLVHPHRDPRDTTPSWAKFMCGMWPLQSNPIDPRIMGAQVQKQWSTAMNRYLQARERLKLDDRIIDVKYEQVRTDPMSIVHEVFERSGRTLAPGAQKAMAHWHDTNEQGRHGRHEYTLEEFGLSNASIDAAFAEYIRRFIRR